jgi:uncharacterized protein YecT (DUF1311 family)/outer membrane murein-binding lipoprotein Lpp
VKTNRKKRMVMFILVLILLAGCGKSPDELSAKSNTESSDRNSPNKDLADLEKDKSENSSEGEKSADNNNANQSEDTSNNASGKEEDPSANNTDGSLKEEYLKKLTIAKKETEELEATDSSTYALKEVENKRWEIWDQLLNAIYGALKVQLSQEEMELLREEQRNWIKSRDERALEASNEYKGGTQEQLEYVAVLANLTEERCNELVEKYMK